MFEFYYPDTIYAASSIWSSLFVTLLGTFIGFLGAFYLVNKNIAKQKKINELKKLDGFKKRLSYFSLLIDNSLTTIDTQINNFESLAKNIKENPTEINLLPIVASIDLERLQRIDSIEIFKAYNEIMPYHERKLKDFKNIYYSIDYLNLRIQQVFKSNENHILFLNKDQMYLKGIIDNLGDKIFVLIMSIEMKISDYKTNPDYIFLTKSHTRYYELVESGANLSQFEIEFLIPFGEEIKSNYSKTPYFLELYEYISKSIKRFNHVKLNSIEFSIELFDIRKEMDVSIRNLRTNNEKLNNQIST